MELVYSPSVSTAVPNHFFFTTHSWYDWSSTTYHGLLLKFTSVIPIGEVQKKGLQVFRCPVFVKISMKSKKRAFRRMFLTMVPHYPPKLHILPLESKLPPGGNHCVSKSCPLKKELQLTFGKKSWGFPKKKPCGPPQFFTALLSSKS